MIAPQKSYLPLGSLKGALLYPEPDLAVGDAELAAVLERVGLGALAPRLDEVARWDQVLANGERQRLAVARLLLHKPQVIVLDDALSALEDEVQETLLSRLRSDLPGAHRHQPGTAAGSGRPPRPPVRARAQRARRRPGARRRAGRSPTQRARANGRASRHRR